MEIGYVNAVDCFVIVYKGVFNSMLLECYWQPFFLAGLFTFLSRQPTVSQLRASAKTALELSS